MLISLYILNVPIILWNTIRYTATHRETTQLMLSSLSIGSRHCPCPLTYQVTRIILVMRVFSFGKCHNLQIFRQVIICFKFQNWIQTILNPQSWYLEKSLWRYPFAIYTPNRFVCCWSLASQGGLGAVPGHSLGLLFWLCVVRSQRMLDMGVYAASWIAI
mgnify:CR=1 FL=1